MKIFRKRIIPAEVRELKDDIILYEDKSKIVTKWKVLNPRVDFTHGFSCYFIEEGIKVSKFLKADGSLKRWYCDIVSMEIKDDICTMTDLLADVIIRRNGEVQVVDLDELADAYEKELISKEEMLGALRKLDKLLTKIRKGKFGEYQKVLDDAELSCKVPGDIL